VGDTTKKVYDIYGDANSPTNHGGLCAKGAGAYQLVNNVRRIGVPEHTAGVLNGDGKDMTGTAWKRIGNAAWTPITLDTAMGEIATGLVSIRNAHTASWPATYVAGSNAQAVQFFGCSHMNNEQNYLYRKLIADFGTSRVEHQARI
jgi:formate dehydrogenase major subunit